MRSYMNPQVELRITNPHLGRLSSQKVVADCCFPKALASEVGSKIALEQTREQCVTWNITLDVAGLELFHEPTGVCLGNGLGHGELGAHQHRGRESERQTHLKWYRLQLRSASMSAFHPFLPFETRLLS